MSFRQQNVEPKHLLGFMAPFGNTGTVPSLRSLKKNAVSAVKVVKRKLGDDGFTILIRFKFAL